MFTIADGREHFFQWDLNRQIIVSDPTVDEVHFCNKTDDCSLVLEVEEEVLAERLDGTKVIQRYVNVPNILLQDALPTKVEKIFKVCPRTKPADYIYTETEIKRWEDTVNKADETLDRANEVLDGAEDILVQAQESADSASTSASDALESAAKANESEVNAATSETNAAKSATDALSNANKSKQSEINAQTAALDAVSAKDDVFEKLEGFDEKVESVNTNAQIASESATSAANTVNGFNEYVEGHKLEFTHDGNGAVTLEGVELNDLDNYYTKEETYNKTEIDALIPSVPFEYTIWFSAGFSYLTDEDKKIIKDVFLNNESTIDARNIYFGWSGIRYNIAKIEKGTDYMKWYGSFDANTGIECYIRLSFDDNNDLESCSLGERKLSEKFATKNYVDTAIENIPDPDLSEYALKTELPSTEGLATEEYVDTAISNIPIPSGGLEIVTIFEGPESPTAGREYTTTENIKYYVVLCGASLASGAAWTHFVPANSTDIRFLINPSNQTTVKYNGSANSLKIVSGSDLKVHYVFGFK